jgi:hypothetical protein
VKDAFCDSDTVSKTDTFNLLNNLQAVAFKAAGVADDSVSCPVNRR